MVVEPIARALRPETAQAWSAAFGRATALGAVARPPLEAALAVERDHRVRLLWIATIAAADFEGSGPLLRERHTAVRGSTDDVRERLLIGLLLALGPVREGPAPDLIRGLRRGSRGRPLEVQEVVATLLALARHPDAVVPDELLRRDATDPGIAAASRFARPLDDDPTLGAWFDGGLTGAPLVQRAVLLRTALTDPDTLRAGRALAVLTQPGDSGREARIAAAYAIATAPDPVPWFERIGAAFTDDVVVALSTAPAFRRALFASGRLGVPSRRLSAVDRGRLAVAYGLAADAGSLRDTRAAWSREIDLARLLCLAVAWRAASGDGAIDRGWLGALPDEPELEWARIAVGEPVVHRTRTFDDAELDAAFVLAARGDLPASAVAAVLEGALWRAAVHPDAARLDAEHRLVRDLLIAGSVHGRQSPVPSDPGDYFPSGLAAGDPAFEIADAAWRYFRVPGPLRRPPSPRRRRPARG